SSACQLGQAARSGELPSEAPALNQFSAVMMAIARETPPLADELEVSIIGPGRGECVLIHLGDNDWCVVDSCISRGSNEPVATEYLRGFRNGALNNVKLIVATHWHDDHIRGLSSLLRDSPGTRFGCSAALSTDNFALLLEIASESIQ